MVNKSTLIERIADLAREGYLEGLSDLRDESDRQGMRIVLEMTKNADPDIILRDLYKRTPMQSTFSINLLALVDGEPRTLTLKQALRVYIEHRLTVIKRRAEFDLEKAKARAHILEGYLVALKNLDELIELIRSASDVDAARSRLMKRYKLTELQATAILDMQLRRLAALERKKIETEYKEVTGTIKDLTTLLKSPKLMRGVVADELLKVKELYGDRRRTQIVNLSKSKDRRDGRWFGLAHA
jgi:DNA gyrase subunit A